MSFDALESSTESGEPVELYEFGYQGGVFRYTSASQSFNYGARVYTATPGLSRAAVTESGELAKASLSITAPEDFEVARLFEVVPPSDVVDLVITRVHRSEPDAGVTLWLGRVLNVSWSTGYSTLTCESIYTRLRTPGLRRVYSRNCPHTLYGAECRANQIGFSETIVLNTVPDSQFELESTQFGTYPSGYFSGGKLFWEAGGGVIEWRGIRKHEGNVVTITHPIPGILPTSTVVAYPGCDKTLETCQSRFSNQLNFGGFPFIPQKNPFGQNSVF